MPDEPQNTTTTEAIEPTADETITTATVEERVYQLTIELYDMQEKKKASNKAFGDEIKRIKGEIEDILNEEEGEDEPAEAPEGEEEGE